MPVLSPYYHHPLPAAIQAADDVFYYISQHQALRELLSQGKMLGILIVETENDDSRVHYLNNIKYLVAYSGVINGISAADSLYFVPPVYDLQNPDDFYLTKDQYITQINTQIHAIDQIIPENKQEEKRIRAQRDALKLQRRMLSDALQREIFSHFNFANDQQRYRNIIDIFTDAKRGLPPGGSGECAAPRLLHYAHTHNLKPIELVEFWYGRSPQKIQRIHGQFYPSCIEKCSPILSYLLPKGQDQQSDDWQHLVSWPKIHILYEDDDLIVVVKPNGLLSVPSKDLNEPNLETVLHAMYPDVKGPMLAHRLDQATSGVMLAAKNATAFKQLQQQFEAKTIHKLYKATVAINVKSQCGIISLPLTVNPDDRPRQVVDWQYGKTAVTYYEVLSRQSDTSVLALYPLTGRTHQLRVHCVSPYGLDTPIMGDCLYDILDSKGSNDKKIKCLQLHAESIAFIHPTLGQEMTFSWPKDSLLTQNIE